MGIKGWLTVCGVVLTGIAVLLGLKKEEDERNVKIQDMIQNVDRKKPEKSKEETTEKIIDDIEKSFRDMGLDKEDDDGDAIGTVNAQTDKLKSISQTIDRANKKTEEAIRMTEETLRKANEMLGDSEANRQKEKELEETLRKMNEDPEFAKAQAAKAEAEYKRKVKKAVEQKNWSRLEDLFDGRYAGGPWHPSPESVFSEACSHGDISEEILKMAEEHFGKLWCYSGD